MPLTSPRRDFATDTTRARAPERWPTNREEHLVKLARSINDLSDYVDENIGSGEEYELAKAPGNSVGLQLANTEAPIEWADPTISDEDDSVTISGTEIIINATGVYKFTVSVGTNISEDTEFIIRTYVNAGGGYVKQQKEIAVAHFIKS